MQKVLHQYSSLFSVMTTVRYVSKNWQPKSQFWILQRQQECITQFLLPSHLLLKMHGCCPNEVCLENLTTYLASSSSIAYKASVWRKLAIIVIFYFLICVTETIFKHRNYSLFYSLHSETLQSIHGISQIFQREFL